MTKKLKKCVECDTILKISGMPGTVLSLVCPNEDCKLYKKSQYIKQPRKYKWVKVRYSS